MNTTGYTDSSGRLHHSVISRSPCGPVHVGEVRGAPWSSSRAWSTVASPLEQTLKAVPLPTQTPPSNTKRAWPY
jgi:hypothetical protein